MRIACAAALLAMVGCATPAPPPSTTPLIPCSEPRPQVCTMEYAPVCADLVTGDLREYASACNACADSSVAGYRPGACPE